MLLNHTIHWNADCTQILIYLGSERQVSLTIREYHILQEILRGKTALEIATQKNLSPKTIETYIMRIKLKLGCKKQRDIISLLIWHDMAKEILLFDLVAKPTPID